ncbi:hypothetical protein [Spirosoma oryzicola]|uniref:hypothetical protein n=1 Tax=Spirosoma oryzicola TaxID=2898794 RepID=UPI001E381B82|nr:hypothetical protein [Spirosoma oryzicola]UHG94016.1 hypothetical protein LQ777_25950 [Spirosoma oryzicola]
MNKLTRAQLDLVVQHIQQAKPHHALQAELIDHMASLIEQRMDQGEDFSAAYNQLTQQATVQAMNQLRQVYSREFGGSTARTTRLKIRQKRRPATKPFQYMLLSSVLTFLVLMGFLIVVSRPLSIPIGVFQTAWGMGLTSLTGVLIIRWWLTRRSSKSKLFTMA